LNFSSAIDPKTYEVEVNGQAAPVERADYRPDLGQLELQLAAAALNPGDQVTVFWNGLQTDEGRSLFGHAGPIETTVVQ
jgi:hypothetical protein